MTPKADRQHEERVHHRGVAGLEAAAGDERQREPDDERQRADAATPSARPGRAQVDVDVPAAAAAGEEGEQREQRRAAGRASSPSDHPPAGEVDDADRRAPVGGLASACPTACRCAASGTRTSAATARTAGRRRRGATTAARGRGCRRRLGGRHTSHSCRRRRRRRGRTPSTACRASARSPPRRRRGGRGVGCSTARHQREVPEQHEHHREHVHAGLGGVPDRVRRRRDDQRPRSTRPAAPTGRPPRRRPAKYASGSDAPRARPTAPARRRRRRRRPPSSRGAARSRAAARRRASAPPRGPEREAGRC